MSYRLRALAHAATHVGVKEHPPNSNHGIQIDYWCRRTNGINGGYPWCAAFIFNMFLDAGVDLQKQGLVGPALVENWVRWARTKGYVVGRPLKGDVVCFDWGQPDGWRDHVGIVARTLSLRWRNRIFIGWIETIEGNTSTQQDTSGSQSNGGIVARRRRWVNGGQVFVRIPGP